MPCTCTCTCRAHAVHTPCTCTHALHACHTKVCARVREHLLGLCTGAAEVDALLAPRIDDTEARCRWWSVLPESSEEVHERVAELLRQAPPAAITRARSTA